MPEFISLWQDGPLFAQAGHFRIGTDSILLADFANLSNIRNGVDLGCASGIVALLLLTRSEKLRMTGLELVPEAAELARANLEKNGLSDRGSVVCGDIRNSRSLFRTGEFDLVICNPPYFPKGSGPVSPDADKASARGELECSLDDICSAVSYLLHTGGSFVLVHKPERLSEVFCRMTAHGLEPKRLRCVCHTAGSAPNLVLIEGRRGGRPGLSIEPSLILRNADGTETDEVLKIYHRDI